VSDASADRPAPAEGAPVDAIVVVAMEDEAQPFLARASSVGEPFRWGRALHRHLVVDGARIHLVRSGVGLVNAAVATTEALLASAPQPPRSEGEEAPRRSAPLVVSAGSAGGVGEDVRVGEVVVGSTYVNIDADAEVFGYVLGQVPGMPPFYEGDAAALGAAPTTGTTAAGVSFDVRHGLAVSSYAFMQGGKLPWVRETFPGVLATDMESFAIAQACFLQGVPFVAVRGISDLADPTAAADHLAHVDDAADRSAAVVLALVAARRSG